MEKSNKTSLGQIVALVLLIISFCMMAYGVLSLDSMHIFNKGTEEDDNYTGDSVSENKPAEPNYQDKLKEISNKFNELNAIKEYTKDGTMTIKSTTKDNKLIINVVSDKEYELDFNLNGKILEKSSEQSDASFYTLYGVYIATAKAVVDGYDETLAMNTINNSYASMTLDTNGIEMYQTAIGGVSFKLDLSKKINIPNI